MTLQRRPEHRAEVVGGDVEQQPLGRADEVQVEHRQQLPGGILARVGEEAAGEHFQRQVPDSRRETEVVKELLSTDPVEIVEGLREVEIEHP